MADGAAVQFDDVWKKFRQGERHDSLRDLGPALIARLTRRRDPQALRDQEFWALREVSFEVPRGKTVALVVAGVFAFYWFANQWAVALRGLAVAAGLVLGGVVFVTTAKGREVLEFLGESRFELRKVVWPSRQQAMRTTWVVIVVVIAVSLLLAGFDVVIQWAVKLLLGR